jgi:serine protease Do/serine protease DegQ
MKSKFIHLMLTLSLACFTYAEKPLSLPERLKQAQPAVVNIDVQVHVPTHQPNQPTPAPYAVAEGSGVIINAEKGYIVTNNHVVQNAKNMVVTLSNGERYIAKLIGQDPGTDVAVVQIQAKNLKALPLDHHIDPKIGDHVAAIGSPYGLQETVTTGVVSAVHRQIGLLPGLEDFIQTDATINPGNSGGALLNEKGQLIGINTAIISNNGGSIGIGFAIPVYLVESITKQIIDHGNVQYGSVGILGQTLTPSIAKAMQLPDTNGVILTEVMPHAPADTAKIKKDDVITKINGKPISSILMLKTLIGIHRPDSKIKLELIRIKGNRPTTLNKTVTLTDPQKLTTESHSPLQGTILKDTVEFTATQEKIKGIKITATTPGTPAWLAGVQVDDILVELNHKPLTSIDDLKLIDQNSSPLLFRVLRHHQPMLIVVGH